MAGIGTCRYSKLKGISTTVPWRGARLILAVAALSACSDTAMPDRSLERGDLPTPNAASSQAASVLAVGSQTNLLGDLPAAARARRCAFAVGWLAQRVDAAGVLTSGQLAALAEIGERFRAQAAAADPQSNITDTGVDQATASPAETLQTALECIRY